MFSPYLKQHCFAKKLQRERSHFENTTAGEQKGQQQQTIILQIPLGKRG